VWIEAGGRLGELGYVYQAEAGLALALTVVVFLATAIAIRRTGRATDGSGIGGPSRRRGLTAAVIGGVAVAAFVASAPAMTRDLARVHQQQGARFLQSRGYERAIRYFRSAVKLNDDDIDSSRSLAFLLAAAPQEQLRDGAEAVRLAERLAASGSRTDPHVMVALAAAYAEVSRFADARRAAQEAADLATARGLTALAHDARSLLALFSVGRPYRLPAP
jgi:Flp pilus assembly protein TadD